jgi:hypothetical protein
MRRALALPSQKPHGGLSSGRFTQPLDMNAARHVAEQWRTASDVVQTFPDAGAVRQFLTWLEQFSLGRKRLLDTLLAATCWQASNRSLPPTSRTSWFSASFRASRPGEAARIPERVGR